MTAITARVRAQLLDELCDQLHADFLAVIAHQKTLMVGERWWETAEYEAAARKVDRILAAQVYLTELAIAATRLAAARQATVRTRRVAA